MQAYFLNGLLGAAWWQVLLTCLACTQLTIISVTVYLHRAQAHRALTVSPRLAVFFRLWLWLTTSMSTREWVAVHRKHHAKCDTAEDPHSPQFKGILQVLFGGVVYYVKEVRNPETLERYAHGTPNDWLERVLFRRARYAGLVVLALANCIAFGWWQGLVAFAIEALWIPFWAAGVINGLAHYAGYQNFNVGDFSRNLVPWGLWIGGEELHNNHHAFPTSAKLSFHAWELDAGWGVICVLQRLKLATVHKAIKPPDICAAPKALCDEGLLESLVRSRLYVGRWYHQAWTAAVAQEVRTQAFAGHLRRAANVFLQVDSAQPSAVRAAVAGNPTLQALHLQWHQLCALWQDRKATRSELVERLNHWCATADASGVSQLAVISMRIRSLQGVT